MSTTVSLYSLSAKDSKTYLLATLFIAGNIILPQICHLIPQGGLIFLPIYFFTLIGAYKYGWKVGMLTALLSPIINNLLFGMPPVAVLPIILIKSSLLAIVASMAAHYFKRVNILTLALVIASYQAVGTMLEWAIVKDFTIAVQDFRIGIPGMLLQIVGGFIVLKHILNK